MMMLKKRMLMTITLEARTVMIITLEAKATTKVGDTSNWKGFKLLWTNQLWTWTEHT